MRKSASPPRFSRRSDTVLQRTGHPSRTADGASVAATRVPLTVDKQGDRRLPGSIGTPRRSRSIGSRSGGPEPTPRPSSGHGGGSSRDAEPVPTAFIRSADLMAVVCAHLALAALRAATRYSCIVYFLYTCFNALAIKIAKNISLVRIKKTEL